MVARVVVGVLVMGALAALQPAADAAVLHRIVWDAGTRDAPRIKIVSAELDGSDQRVIFRRGRGFVTALDLNPQGTEVAFAPFEPRDRPAELLVADVRSGERRDLLADAQRFAVLGGIGWSPDGRRLVFEGWVDEDGHRNGYLWTIRRDGSDLTRRTVLETRGDQWMSSNHLAWTRHGIYFTGADGLMVLDVGAARLALPRTWSPLVSGDGRWVQVLSWGDGAHSRSLRMRADGSHLTRTQLRQGRSRLGWVHPLALDRSGRQMISEVDPGDGRPVDVVHDATRSPRKHDRRLDFLHGAYVVDWN